MRLGTARIDITPPIGTELCGYGAYRQRASTGILDNLYSRAVYVESGKTRILFIANDLLGVTAELTEKIRELCKKHLGLPGKSVMLSATHTHSGPSTFGGYGWGEVDPLYLDHLPYAWLELAKKAISTAKSAKLYWTSGQIDVGPFAYDRHDPDGPVDTEVRTAVFKVGGKPKAILVNTSIHGVVFGSQNTMVSGDWPGRLENALEKKYKDSIAIFVQGTSGTINARPTCVGLKEGRKHIEKIGEYIAGETIKLIESAAIHEDDNTSLKVARKIVQLPLKLVSKKELAASRNEQIAAPKDTKRSVDEKNMDRLCSGVCQKLIDHYVDGSQKGCPAEVQLFRIGKLYIVSMPGEMFMALGKEILKSCKDGMVMLAGYTNDFKGYFPTREAYGDPRYHYPTQMVPIIMGESPYKPGVGELLVRTAKGLLRTIG